MSVATLSLEGSGKMKHVELKIVGTAKVTKLAFILVVELASLPEVLTHSTIMILSHCHKL